MMTAHRTAAAVICLFLLLPGIARGRNYARALVENLLEIGYPISREDVVALDKISMRFDSWNRLDVLKKILSDRDRIHRIMDADYYAKTGAVCYALRLLDEHNLPETDALIERLSRMDGWEKRERVLLSYMAAKRNIDYDSNISFLLENLRQYENGAGNDDDIEISVSILDFCDNLSYLSDIFSHSGDITIGHALIRFAAHAYGYPAEYASRLLVDMCLQQPETYISILAGTDDPQRKIIIKAMVFGIWNNQQKENVLHTLIEKISPRNDSEKQAISLLTKLIRRRFPSESTDDRGAQIDPKTPQ